MVELEGSIILEPAASAYRFSLEIPKELPDFLAVLL